MTRQEYLDLRAKQFGIKNTLIRSFESIKNSSDALSYSAEASICSSRFAKVRSRIKKEGRDIDDRIYRLENALPELRERAEEAKEKIAHIRQEVELADCLTRFDKMGVSLSDPLFNLKFTFQHHLDLAMPYIQALYGNRPLDLDKVISDPNYLDELILDDPKAVYLRGFLFLVAEGAYQQHHQPKNVLDYIVNNPQIDTETIEYLLVYQTEVYNNTYVQERLGFYLETLTTLRDNGDLIDDRTNGHHLNYLMLPSIDIHNELIKISGIDKDGNFYTDEEIEQFLSSLASRPMLDVDFGQKKLIRLTEPFLKYQEKTGKINHEFKHYRDSDVVAQYNAMVGR